VQVATGALAAVGGALLAAGCMGGDDRARTSRSRRDTSYDDETVLSGETYIYEVAWVRGTESSEERAATTVEVKRPPPGQPASRGWFRLTGPIVEVSGFAEMRRTTFSIQSSPLPRGVSGGRYKGSHGAPPDSAARSKTR
jgi:hypothetical protein